MNENSFERGSGVALWRQIAERIRQGVADGSLAREGKLLPETALASLFGVNRHTVRSAIAALVQEGVLQAQQGRGTFIREARRISYALGARTRFSSNLEGQARETHSRMLNNAIVGASATIAAELGIEEGASVLRLDMIGKADSQLLSRATHWFEADRFPDLVHHYEKTGSITAALKRHGIEDYIRRSTSISARHADASALSELLLAPGAIVLVTSAINETTDGMAFQFSETLFPADRVELLVSRDDKRGQQRR